MSIYDYTRSHKVWCQRVNPPYFLDDVCDCGVEAENQAEADKGGFFQVKGRTHDKQ